jgi:hypothetical protein
LEPNIELVNKVLKWINELENMWFLCQ